MFFNTNNSIQCVDFLMDGNMKTGLSWFTVIVTIIIFHSTSR